MEFSEKLKILRTESGFTQTELADKLAISRQAISNYEQGRNYPSIDIGYRTKRSMKNQLMWDYAQAYFSWLK